MVVKSLQSSTGLFNTAQLSMFVEDWSASVHPIRVAQVFLLKELLTKGTGSTGNIQKQTWLDKTIVK